MQLRISRSQTSKGVMTKTVVFVLDARTELTAEEQANVKKYGLGSQVIYNSEASKKHIANADAHLGRQNMTGALRSIASVARAKLSLNITVDGLQKGQHIECKSLDEVLGAEEALTQACENLQGYLSVASTFDGSEAVFDYPIYKTIQPPQEALSA